MSSVAGPLRAGLCVAAVFLLGTPSSAAPAHCAPSLAHSCAAVTTLHAFAGGAADGKSPAAGLIFDRAGTTLYGTTQFGGRKRKGTVFAIDPISGETTILHSFKDLAGGFFPQAGLVADTKGLLYGTTISISTAGAGAVYRLNPATGKFSVLHSFLGGNDGFFPSAPLLLDTSGHLYGTTTEGGGGGNRNVCPQFCGTAFRLDIKTGAITILHAFTDGADGGHPFGGLVSGPDGMLYGATFDGGSSSCGVAGCGTVFKLDPGTGALTTLHAFTKSAQDGAFPLGNLVFDKAGTIFGTTEGGGARNSGTVYRLDPASGAMTLLHTFTFDDGNGAFPAAGLTFDGTGTLLYGTTIFGGMNGCKAAGDAGCGTVFTLDPANGAFNVAYKFTGNADGGNPDAPVVFDNQGAVYGTTEFGGVAKAGGTVFKLTP